MKRTITIDRVVIANASVSEREREAFRGAVTEELARMVESEGASPAADSLAGNVAATIFDAMGKAE